MSGGPKEGVYRAAALQVIGEQLEERIDELSRRRRRLTKIGVAGLIVAVLGSGSLAAYAVSSANAESHAAGPGSASVAATASCTDGVGESAVYFTVRFQDAEGQRVDEARLCSAVRAGLLADPARYRNLSPDRAIEAAAALLGTSGAQHVTVEEATFGSLASAGDG